MLWILSLQQNIWRFISVAGVRNRLLLSRNKNQPDINCKSLTVAFIPDYIQEHTSFNITGCKEAEFFTKVQKMFKNYLCFKGNKIQCENECWNLSHSNGRSSYLMIRNVFYLINYFGPYKIFKVDFKNSFYLSWVIASHMCKQVGGHLPYFSHKEEVDHFSMFFQVTDDINPVEAVFIGVASYKVNGLLGASSRCTTLANLL